MKKLLYFLLSFLWAFYIEHQLGVQVLVGDNNLLWVPVLILFPLFPLACIRWLGPVGKETQSILGGLVLGAGLSFAIFATTQLMSAIEKGVASLEGIASKIVFGAVLVGIPALILIIKYHRKKKQKPS